jgi:anaerobic magnesium-protoporphyrin IX monomethyl ester cyclase
MSTVLLTHSYFYKLDPKQWRAKQPYPPLGTLQAAAVLREAGFGIYFFDSNLKNDPSEITPEIRRVKPKYVVIYDDGFNYLTKMCLTIMREAAFTIAKEGKKAGSIVIINSSDSTDQYEKYLSMGVDYVVRGEGEETLKELVTKLEGNENVENVGGVAFRKNGNTITNLSRPVLRNLDTLPLPAWDLADLEEYRDIWKKHHGYFSLNLATTRGCPYKCNWCAKPIYGNRYNVRSPEHVVHEIEFLLAHYAPDHFWMCDDIFGLKPGWVQTFQRLVNERNLRFKYKIQSRVDLLLQENTIEALKHSGAETVWVGAESGSQKVLDSMDKGTTVEQIYHATKLLKQHKIRTAFFLQFGYLGETQEDIQATLSMVLNLMPDEIGISVSYPLPGTKFYDNVKDMLKEKQNWSDSDDLAMMFKSTYSPAYYKILHRYIHNRYRIQRGINQLKKSVSFKKYYFKNIASMVYNTPLSWVHQYQLNRLSRVT